MIAGISLLLVATLVAGGFYWKYEKEKQAAEQARMEAERLEKLEAEEKAKELAEKEAKIKAQLAKEEKERQAQKLAEEKAKAEAEEKEKAKKEEEAKEIAKAEEVVVMTTPKTVAPLTGKTDKQNVTEKAVITPQVKLENKIEPKPQQDTPPADLVEHQKAEKEAEQKAKADSQAPKVNASGNGISANDDPNNPFNNLPAGPTWGEDKSEMRQLWDPSTGYGEPGKGDKF